jgi:hypothetical protein
LAAARKHLEQEEAKAPQSSAAASARAKLEKLLARSSTVPQVLRVADLDALAQLHERLFGHGKEIAKFTRNPRNIPELCNRLRKLRLLAPLVATQQCALLTRIFLAIGQSERGMKALVAANLGEVVPVRSVRSASLPLEDGAAAAGLFRRVLEAALSCASMEAITNGVSLMFIAAV